MARRAMTSFPLTVLLAFSLSFISESNLTDKQRDKLDEIEALLRRLQNELDHMRRTDDNTRRITKSPSVRNVTDADVINGSNNDNRTETFNETTGNRTDEDNDIRNLTTPLEDRTTQNMKVDSYTTISDSTSEILDSAATSSDRKTSSRDQPEVTTVPIHATPQESTVPPRFLVTQTSGMFQTTAEKDDEDKKNKDQEDKDKENKDNGENETKEREEENELRDVQNVRRLIDEGEYLERELKGVFLQLRSLSRCTPVGEKCGVREGQTKCCKGLKCSDSRSGTCKLDCVPFGESCAENFFCCSEHQCKMSADRNGQNTYVCQ